MRRLIVVITAISSLLAACGGSGDGREPDETATPDAPPRISEASMCALLFEGQDKPLNDLVEVWDLDVVDQSQVDNLSENIDLLRDLASRAPQAFEPHIDVIADLTAQYVNAAETGIAMTLTKTDLQASGYELATACGGYGY